MFFTLYFLIRCLVIKPESMIVNKLTLFMRFSNETKLLLNRHPLAYLNNLALCANPTPAGMRVSGRNLGHGKKAPNRQYGSEKESQQMSSPGHVWNREKQKKIIFDTAMDSVPTNY